MIYLCYVHEETKFQEIYQWIDKWCHNAKVFPVIIYEGQHQTTFAPWYFRSYNEARYSEELRNAHWVYLDEHSGVQLHEYVHPEEDVVYALGSDYDGFGDHIKSGDVVSVEGGQQYAAVIAPSVLYDRYLKGKLK